MLIFKKFVNMQVSKRGIYGKHEFSIIQSIENLVSLLIPN